MANSNQVLEQWHLDPSHYTHFTIQPGQGPSKMDLVNALMSAFEDKKRTPSEPLRVQFKVVSGEDTERKGAAVITTYVRIILLGHEDGSGRSFLFKGLASTQSDWRKARCRERMCYGYYNARTRTGYLRQENDVPASPPQA